MYYYLKAMNIIKFYDIKMEGADDTAQFFNDHLKGKYAYAVRMQWIFPFEKLNTEEFIGLENGNVDISTFEQFVDYLSLDFCNSFVDESETAKVNSISKFLYKNSYATDSDITLDDIKRFRTWLAESLLKANEESDFIKDFVLENTSFDEEMVVAMLEYYAGEMSDATTKMLSMFAPGTVVQLGLTRQLNTCGCNHGSTMQLAGAASVCDPLMTYTNNLYKYMVNTFSEIDFWYNDYLRDTILIDFKNYIDNIIKTNLPLSSFIPSQFEDCTCMTTDADTQKRYQAILNRLSQSLQYMIEGKVDGYKNFIRSALNDWATYLYENMRW